VEVVPSETLRLVKLPSHQYHQHTNSEFFKERRCPPYHNI